MNLKIRRLVKNNTMQVLRLVAGVLLLAAVISSCNDQNDLGLEVLPGSDLITVKEVVIKNDISAYNYSEEDLISSGGTSLLGSFNDPDFGSTNIDFAAQFRLTSYPPFGTNTVVDSVRLYLYYKSIYGDTLTTQHFSVYELEAPLDADQDYTQDIDLKAMTYGQLLGEISHTPKMEIDSATRDTAFQSIVIPIDTTLGNKLVNLDSTILSNNDLLLNAFKGLFIESQKITTDLGTILTLETASASRLVVYYNNQENIEKETPDTLYTSFIITGNSARVNGIDHDYLGTSFGPHLNQQTVQSENLYVQPTGGLKSLLIIDGLEDWKDSVNVGINKAELVFQTDTIDTKKDIFAPPTQLTLTFIDDEGEERLPKDYYFSPTFHGGFLYQDYKYRFNITQHLQAIIDGEVDNNGFYLSTGRTTQNAKRVILEGATTATGIQLIVTYSTFSE